MTELPECLKSWDVLKAPRPKYAQNSPMAFPQFTSQWLSMNVLSIDKERVLVDLEGHPALVVPTVLWRHYRPADPPAQSTRPDPEAQGGLDPPARPGAPPPRSRR